MLIDEPTIRFADESEISLLAPQVYVTAEVLRRKIEVSELIVAISGNELRGFLQIEYLWSKVPYIALIRVLNDYRRRGIGKAMLSFLEDHLIVQGHSNLYSSSQADEPEPQAWHRHVGFEECGIIKEINDGIDEVFFRKTISGR